MSYTLYGSKTSPYVRRIRLFLNNVTHIFSEINYLDEEQNLKLKKINPIMKIPVLVDNQMPIFESRIIHRYLASHWGEKALSWEQENHISMMDGALDSFINLFLLRKSGINIDDPKFFYLVRQKERALEILSQLEKLCSEKKFNNWDYVSHSLYSFLDWADFRQFLPLNEPAYQHLKEWRNAQNERPQVKNTDPRLAV